MKKLISCLLLIAMLVTALAACQKKNENEETQTTNDRANQILDEYGRPYLSNPLVEEGIRFDDTVISILYYDDYQVYDPDQVGELVNDANLSRDLSVESALGVILEYKYTPKAGQMTEYNDLVVKSISAGGTPYNILMTHPYYSANMAIEGYYQNVHELKYVDFDQPWWTEKVMDEITVNDVSYFASGDMTTANCGATSCMYFNKNLYNARYTENIYETVEAKDWTMEKFNAMVKESHVDNDGVAGSSQNDFLGLAASPGVATADPLMFGFGIHITKLDANGDLQIALGDELSVNAFTAVYDLVNANDGVWHNNSADSKDVAWIYPKFANGQSLFHIGYFYDTKSFTEMTDKFGVLPTPLLDASQTEYHSGGVDGLLAIPINAPELDATAATMELLNYFGYQYTVPVYFEKMLKTMYADAPEDSAMYEMLHEVKTIDFGAVYSFAMGDPLWSWRKQLRTESNGIVSHWETQVPIYSDGLTNIMEAFRQLGV